MPELTEKGLRNLTWEMLRSAIGEFLRLAYPIDPVPETIQKRITFNESLPLADHLNAPPFEKYHANAPFPCCVYALRLGSAVYPHLKMEIRPFTNQLGFVFWVNTHDQFISRQEACHDMDLWRQVMEKNRDLKQAVERAWAAQGLPTFATALQEESDATESRPYGS